MRQQTLSALLVFTGLTFQACAAHHQSEVKPGPTQPDTAKTLTRIAFGSCSDASKPLPAFDAIIESKPDLMIFLGDNVYADTTDEDELLASYQQLADNEYFQRLTKACPILATWDDHDYGINDAGYEHPAKAMSQRVFLDYWNEPTDSPRRQREGIYDAKTFGPLGKRVQIILLDTRYHRSPLTPRTQEERAKGGGPYKPNPDTALTMLGEQQWRWLEQQLKQPAELRIIASSVQVIAEEHHWETWAMMPTERQKLFDLIRDTDAKGVVFISGDRHQAELSRLAGNKPYPLYDLTASSFNKPGLANEEPNQHRIGKRYPSANFGLISIDWSNKDPLVTLSIHNPENVARIEHTIPLTEINAPN